MVIEETFIYQSRKVALVGSSETGHWEEQQHVRLNRWVIGDNVICLMVNI